MSTGSGPHDRLDVWIASQNNFPRVSGNSYPERLRGVAKYLNREIYPHVLSGVALRDGRLLTDHGREHVESMIERAGDLLAKPTGAVIGYPQLSPYEVYLLLMAIQFHDVGNLFGRERHEANISKVMEKMGPLAGDEMVEKVAIKKIARAHGGQINGDRDTIMTLPTEDLILSHPVRYQLLAAILRFADELAEDYRRAARALARLDAIPDESRVFHMYAESLHSVAVVSDERVVKLRYIFTKEKAKPIVQTGDPVFLLDEIYRRTKKMHYEREYCMRFMRGLVDIEAIDVQIEVYEDEESMDPCVDPIGYRLQQRGYPGDSDASLGDLVSPDRDPPTGCALFLNLSVGGRTV